MGGEHARTASAAPPEGGRGCFFLPTSAVCAAPPPNTRPSKHPSSIYLLDYYSSTALLDETVVAPPNKESQCQRAAHPRKKSFGYAPNSTSLAARDPARSTGRVSFAKRALITHIPRDRRTSICLNLCTGSHRPNVPQPTTASPFRRLSACARPLSFDKAGQAEWHAPHCE